MATPVVTVASGGLAVTETTSGLPVSEGGAYGRAVTKVAGGGLPVTYTGDVATGGGPLVSQRQVATRTQVLNSGGLNAGQTASMNRSTHFARDNITALQLVFANWFVTTAAGVETGTGGIMTLKTSIEYPAGTFTQVKWGGIAAGTIASGATGVSDLTTVSIPNGATFWVRTSLANPSGVLYYDQIANAGIGDRISFTATDLTMSGTVPNDVPGYCFIPQAIVGNTTRRSVLLIGDSTMNGLKDTVDGSGDMGTVARSIGPYTAYTNIGIPSDRAAWFKANNVKRLALLQYFTDVIVGYGKNDSQASVQADLALIYSALKVAAPTIRISAVTVTPQTGGAWTNPAGTDQTSIVADYTALNTFLKALPTNVFQTFDIAPAVSLASPITKWQAPGYTADGIHETQTAALAIVASGAIPAAIFTDARVFMQDGDSLASTNGSATGTTFQTCAVPTLNAGTTIANIAVGGNYLSSTVLNFTANLATPYYKAGYPKFVVHILAGTNDIRRGDALATIYANLQAYVNRVHALGPNAYAVVCSQPLQCDIFGNGPQLTKLHSLNDMIYAGWNTSQQTGGLGADGLIDYFAQPTVGMNTYSSSAFCNVTWSADGQHLVDAGKALMGPLQSAVVNAITGGSTAPLPGVTVPSGLIGYWPLDTIAAADTWAQNNGVATGSPTVVAGQVGSCFNFTGANYVQIPSVSAYNFTTGGYSYAFWINGAAASQPSFGGIISKGEASNDWGLQRDASTTSLVVFHGGTGLDFQTGSFGAVFNSTWNHVALTYDGTTAILYVNGAPFGFTVPIAAPTYNAAFNVRIGAARAAGVPVVAKMDNVKLWNRKLSAAEVTLDYNAGLTGKQ